MEIENIIKIAREKLSAGKKKEALDIILSALDRHGPAKELEIMHAKILIELGELNVAYSLLNKLFTRFPNDPDVAITRGELFLRMREYKKAISHAKKVIKLYPKNKEAYSLLGRVYLMINNIEAAENAFKQGVVVSNGDPSFYNNLAVAQMKMGKLESALENLNHAIEKQPKIPYLINRAAILIKKGLPAKALKDLDRALDEDPHNPNIHAYRGHALMENGMLEEALKEFEKAIELDRNFNTLSGKAMVLTKMGKIDEAEMTYMEAGELTKDLNERLFLVAKIARLNSTSETGRKCQALMAFIHKNNNELKKIANEIDDPLIGFLSDAVENPYQISLKRIKKLEPHDWIDELILAFLNIAAAIVIGGK